MYTNHDQDMPEPTPVASVSFSSAPFDSSASEPEKMSTYPENQQVMPENKPENTRKSSSPVVLSEDNVLYDPEDSGPFAWKPRSPLDRLPLKDQRFILDLLEQHTYEETRAILRSPRPVGLSINPSLSALHGFFYRWRNDALAERLDMLDEQVAYIQAIAGQNDENFVKSSIHLLKRRLLETSISPTSKTAELRTLFSILDRMKNTELAERRIQLAEKKANCQSNSPAASSS